MVVSLVTLKKQPRLEAKGESLRACVRGLADGAGVLGAADPDDWLRAAMAATHVPTTTEVFTAAVV